MKQGSEARGWLAREVPTFKPMAKAALLPDGSESKRHIIQTIEYAWRVVCGRNATGERDISTWQLLPTLPVRA